MFLPKQTFQTVVDSTPLISIDLVVTNSSDQVLLGKRTNRPAQNYWFVPGGRIQKNEAMTNAFSRLCEEELGLTRTMSDAQFLGPYEHFYEDSVFGEHISTHYVVLGFKVVADVQLNALPCSQHNEYAWFSMSEMESNPAVHKHSKWYLPAVKMNRDFQLI